MKKKMLGMVILFFLFLLFAGMATTLFLLYDIDSPDAFHSLFRIPMIFSFCMVGILLNAKRISHYLSAVGIVCMYFLKSVILPLFLAVGNYELLTSNMAILRYLEQAVFLMNYETIFVFFALSIFVRNQVKEKEIQGFREGIFFKLTIASLFLVLVGILSSYPSFIGRFHTIFSIGEPDKYIPVRSWRVSGPEPLGLLDTFMRSVFSLLQTILPAFLIKKIYDRYGIEKSGKAIVLLLSVSFVQFLFMSGENANTIFSVITSFTMICILYYNKIKRMIPLALIGVFFLLFYALFAKQGNIEMSDNTAILVSISKNLNAYFGGVVNVAAACALKAEKEANYLAGDFFSKVPYVSAILLHFVDNISTLDFNEVYWGFAGRTDQLLPAVGQGFLYFGYAFAPVIPCFFVFLAVKFETMAKRSTNIFLKFFNYYSMFILIVLTGGNNLVHLYGYFYRLLIIYFIFRLIKIKFPREKVYCGKE